MNCTKAMSTVTSHTEKFPPGPRIRILALAGPVEALLVFAGILLYIWRWQFSYPRAGVILLATVLVASHLVHRDTLASMGLAQSNLRASAQIVLPLALGIFIPLTIYGLASGTFRLLLPARRVLISFAGYGIWCVFQQYLMQSYIHNRLMGVVHNRHLSSALTALMFGAAHIPNPILMVATTAGGFILAEVFARHRNIWPLALAQTLGGLLIAALAPAPLIHNMRVGPGYFFFGLR